MLRSNFLPCFSSFSKLLHFLHNGSHDHSMALYFLHESLKFIRIIRERIGTSTLPRPLPSTCLIGLLDGFPCCHIGEFLRFSICSTKAGTLPSYAAFASSDLEFRDSTIVLYLNFGGILQKKKRALQWNMHN